MVEMTAARSVHLTGDSKVVKKVVSKVVLKDKMKAVMMVAPRELMKVD